MISASQISFKRAGAERHRSTLGNGSRRTRHRIEGCFKMGKRAIAIAGTKFDPPMGLVPNISHLPAKEEFSAVILDLRLNHNLSRKEIGKVAGVGSETVKAWERGRQMGQWENVARLTRRFHSVRKWALRDLGLDEMPEFMSPRVMTAVMAAAYQVMHQPGPDGEALREELAQGRDPYKGMNKP